MKLFTLILALFTLSSITCVSAQEMLPAPNSRRPVLVDNVKPGLVQNLFAPSGIVSNLSAEQQSAIKEYEIAKKKKILQLDNQLGEKRARLNTLETADKADMKAIDATIDDIAKLYADKMKTKAACMQKIRALLNGEQRLEFDEHQQNYGKNKLRVACSTTLK